MENERVEFEGAPLRNVGRNMLIVFAIIGLFGLCLYYFSNLTFPQVIASTILLATVLGTIVFWSFRLGIAAIGIGLLLITKTIDVTHLIEFASLDVILFLISMMIIVGMVRDVGFFRWLMIKLIKLSKFRLYPLVIILGFISVILAMLVDEVTSIIFIIAIVIEICAQYKMNPLPLAITTVLTTNIGSSGTVLGNPIGILIAMRSGLSFEDFLHWAFPVAILAFIVTMAVIILWYKRYFNEFKKKIESDLSSNDKKEFDEWEEVKNKRDFYVGIAIFFMTLIFIALHRRIEDGFRLEHNTMLLVPVFAGMGIIFLWKRLTANQYLEKDVEWRSLVFFMLLFAMAGTLKYTGVTNIVANKFANIAGKSLPIMITLILWVSGFGSSVLDNVVLVAALIPVIQNLGNLGINTNPLWWALLFGGCYGGNITMIGSTANIVALGILEKRCRVSVTFFKWFGIGLAAGIVATLVAQAFLLAFYKLM